MHIYFVVSITDILCNRQSYSSLILFPTHKLECGTLLNGNQTFTSLTYCWQTHVNLIGRDLDNILKK